MASWIYKQTIATPAGSRLDEIECPFCKCRQTVPDIFRPETCFCCENNVERDELFKNKIIELLTEDGVVGCRGANI